MVERRLSRRRTSVRSMAAAASFLAGALVLSGCSGGGGTITPQPTEDSTEQSAPVTLVVPTSQAPWNPAYAKLVKEYEKETGNTVDLRPFPNPEVKTQQINDVQSQQHVFDVYQINESDLVQFNQNKWIQPLTDVDPNFSPDPEIFSYSNISNWNGSDAVFDADGKITSQPLLGNVDIFIYRKDIYKDLDLKVPTTWDQVISNGKKIKDARAATYGGVFRTQGVAGTYGMSYEFQALMNSAGATWFEEPGKDWTPTSNTAAAVKAGTWLRGLAELGPYATTTIGQAQVIAAMASGDAAQTYAVAAAAAGLEDPSNSAVAGMLGYAPLPVTADGKSSSATGLWVLGVPNGLPDDRAKAALSYIKWMTSKRAMTMFAESGGIPTRSDAYEGSGIRDALVAVQKTATNLPDAPTSLRYAFSTDMLNITESVLQNIAAGTVSPKDGFAGIQKDLVALTKQLKLPVG